MAKSSELTEQSVAKLLELLRETFAFINALKAKQPLAEHIQYPKLPTILSESIATHLIRKGKVLPQLAGAQLIRGTKDADVVALMDGRRIKVEVKATGQAGFSYFYPKDTKADYLVWIHFGKLCSDATCNEIQVHALAAPGTFFPKERKIVLKEFKRIAGAALQVTTLPLGAAPTLVSAS